MSYNFYLDKTLLPVAPEKISMKISNQNKTYNIMNEGEINVLKDAGLTEIEFDCLLPNVKYPFAVYKAGFQRAKQFLSVFEKLKTLKKPFHFIVTRNLPNGKVLFDNDILCSLENYTIKEEANNGFDVSVNIKLKQYRAYSTQTAVITPTTKKAAAPTVKRETKSTSEPEKKSYTVQSGDCLYNIAKKYYGDGSKYTAIYEANKDIIGGNPNLIYPNQKLVIPAV